MKILNIPIEPFESRYSMQWNSYFEDYFSSNAVKYETFYGKSYSKIIDGSFLDVVGTQIYKTSQVIPLLDYINNIIRNDTQETYIVFFHDLWNPVLPFLAYIRDGLSLSNLKIVGCLHAGSYDTQDFLYKKGMSSWARQLESSYLAIADMVFVATEYHKNLIQSSFSVNNIHTTGFPIFSQDKVPPFSLKEDIVVFPHRLDSEKQPALFELLHGHRSMQYLFSMKECNSKKSYYNLLQKSKISVSFALQETWGIAMQESVFAGCLPLVPDRLSYVEMYDNFFRFDSLSDFYEKLDFFISLQQYPKEFFELYNRLINKGKSAIPNIMNLLNQL